MTKILVDKERPQVQENAIYLIRSSGEEIIIVYDIVSALAEIKGRTIETGDRYIMARHLTDTKLHEGKCIFRPTKIMDDIFEQLGFEDKKRDS
jgi:hypothetical protein